MLDLQELGVKVLMNKDVPVVAVAGRKKVRMGEITSIGRQKVLGATRARAKDLI